MKIWPKVQQDDSISGGTCPHKPNGLSSILGIHVKVEGEIGFYEVMLWHALISLIPLYTLITNKHKNMTQGSMRWKGHVPWNTYLRWQTQNLWGKHLILTQKLRGQENSFEYQSFQGILVHDRFLRNLQEIGSTPTKWQAKYYFFFGKKAKNYFHCKYWQYLVHSFQVVHIIV